MIQQVTADTSPTLGKDDLIVITCGLPLAVPGNTNLVKVHRV